MADKSNIDPKMQCSAVHARGGKQCKASKGLVAVRICTVRGNGHWQLPSQVVIYLCPKHFEVRA